VARPRAPARRPDLLRPETRPRSRGQPSGKELPRGHASTTARACTRHSDGADWARPFERAADAWGDKGAFAEEGEGGGEQYVEMIGSQLWVAGMVDLGRFRRVSDWVNLALGYMVVKDAIVLTRTGDATR